MFARLIESVTFARLFALALIALAIFVRIADPIPVQLVRNLTFDLYQRILPRAPEQLPVAIIDIDAPSITESDSGPGPGRALQNSSIKSRMRGPLLLHSTLSLLNQIVCPRRSSQKTMRPCRMALPLLCSACPTTMLFWRRRLQVRGSLSDKRACAAPFDLRFRIATFRKWRMQ